MQNDHASNDDIDHLAAALPKVLLHEHLDGGLRIPTLWSLLERRGMRPPADSPQLLADWFDANVHAGSLEKYLAGFSLTVAAMADPAALERVAFEAAEDARTQGALLAEFRLAPLLFEAHGIGGDAVLEAVLAGLARSPLPSGLIVSGIRNHLPEEGVRTAELAVRWMKRGVVGFDLAGIERGYPASLHEEALRLVRHAGLAITLHAGEADSAERVVEAGRLGAARIGHGVALAAALGRHDQQPLLDEVLELGLHLEVCPSSNIHTGVVAALDHHPIAALRQAGIPLSWHTDNTLISRVTLNSEAAALLRLTPLGLGDLLAMARDAARASFLDASIRVDAERQIEEAMRRISTAA